MDDLGAKIAAIKAYRRQTGAGLRESKAAVERLMQKGG
jgi:ribosomal protein L7/L12